MESVLEAPVGFPYIPLILNWVLPNGSPKGFGSLFLTFSASLLLHTRPLPVTPKTNNKKQQQKKTLNVSKNCSCYANSFLWPFLSSSDMEILGAGANTEVLPWVAAFQDRV